MLSISAISSRARSTSQRKPFNTKLVKLLVMVPIAMSVDFVMLVMVLRFLLGRFKPCLPAMI